MRNGFRKRNLSFNLTLVSIAVSAIGLFLIYVYESKSEINTKSSGKTYVTVGNWNWAVYSDTHEGGTSTICMKLEDDEHIAISGHIEDLYEAEKTSKQFLSFNKKPDSKEKNSVKKSIPYSYAIAEVMPNNAALESLISSSPHSFSFWVKGDGLPYKIVVKTTGDYGNDNYYWVSRVFPKSEEKITIPYIELAPHHAPIDQTTIKSIAFHATTEFIKEDCDFSFTLWWDKAKNNEYSLTSAEQFQHNLD